MKRLLQKHGIFYRLYQHHKEGKKDFIPVFSFMGEIYITELGKWIYVSYECAARMSEIYSENPGLVSRELTRGKSGAKYFSYRFADEASMELIRDESLKWFYRNIKK